MGAMLFRSAAVAVVITLGPAAASARADFAPEVRSPIANGPGPGPAPTTTALVDADRDGRLDVVSTSQFGQGPVLLAPGLGDGRFAAATAVAGSSGLQSLVAGDVSGDGKDDLVGMSGSGVTVLAGDGAGGFTLRSTTPAVIGGQVQAALADTDGDGDPDVVVPTYGAVQVLRNDGTGRLAPATSSPAGGLAFSAVDAADLDGDRYADVLAVDGATGTVAALRGTASGGLSPSGVLPLSGLVPEDVEAIDLDGDHRDDVAVVGSFSFSVATALTDGAGGFRSPVATFRAGRPGPTSAEGADVDGDGREELLVSSLADPRAGAVQLLRAAGGATLADGGVFGVAPFPQDPAAGDIDGDGRLDVVTVSPGSISALIGR